MSPLKEIILNAKASVFSLKSKLVHKNVKTPSTTRINTLVLPANRPIKSFFFQLLVIECEIDIYETPEICPNKSFK